jgi:hypothetical protein
VHECTFSGSRPCVPRAMASAISAIDGRMARPEHDTFVGTPRMTGRDLPDAGPRHRLT